MFQSIFMKIGTFILSIFALFSPVLYKNPVPIISTHSKNSSSTSTPVVNQTKNATTIQVKTKITPPVIPSTSTRPQTLPTISVVSTSPAISTPVPNFDTINSSARSALVNILCTTETAGSFSPVSGSGVMISPDGVILTNAHVAEYYLLKDFNGQPNFVQCLIRTGSPAHAQYIANLIYISPQWVNDNSKLLTEENPTGTGEHDYAFLKIVSTTNGSPLPNTFPYLAINTTQPVHIGDNLLLASYPAGFLGGIAIQENLYQSSAIAQVAHVFTFDTNTTDVISIPGTVVSQRGSSGGAAVNDEDQLTGLISTDTDADTTSTRDLRAITLNYINRDLIENANVNIQTIATNASSISADFNQNIAPQLTTTLTNAILGK